MATLQGPKYKNFPNSFRCGGPAKITKCIVVSVKAIRRKSSLQTNFLHINKLLNWTALTIGYTGETGTGDIVPS